MHESHASTRVLTEEFDPELLVGSVATVGLRMSRQIKYAQRIAEALHGHSKIETVICPTLLGDPNRWLSICFMPVPRRHVLYCPEWEKAASFAFLRHITIGKVAVSLGGVETLAFHSNSTTHSGFTQEEFKATGMSEGLVRISVGIEDRRNLLGRLRTGTGEG
jgi:methionine-gamma-lyase